MKTYINKPNLIQAVQWDGTEALYQSLVAAGCRFNSGELVGKGRVEKLEVHSAHGSMSVAEGDWLILSGVDDWYPCKAEVFAAKYEEFQGAVEGTANELSVAETTTATEVVDSGTVGEVPAV